MVGRWRVGLGLNALQAAGGLLLTAVVPGAMLAVGNPLPNPGFEDGETGWTIAESVSRLVPEAARTGKLGLRVGLERYSPAGSSVTSARLPVEPGQEITVRFWARSTSSTCGVYLFFYNAAGKTIQDPALTASGGNPTRAVSTADGQWHEYRLSAKAPAAAAGVAVWVHAYAGTTGVTDIDDLELAGIAADARPIPVPTRRPRRAAASPPAQMPARAQPPVIVLKLDDVKQVSGRAHPAWERIGAYLTERHIKAGFGVICATLAEATPAYLAWIHQLQAAGIEFWFHGWDHATHDEGGVSCGEFTRRSYEAQKERLDRSQALAQEKLGGTFQTFGPPGGGNAGSFDQNTVRVMADDPHIRIWLYPMPLDDTGKALAAAGKIVILDRVWDVNLESAVGVPDCDRLVAGYATHPDREYFVLQGHPAMWSDERFAEFGRILDFLVAQKAVFMTPAECAARSRKQSPAAAAP